MPSRRSHRRATAPHTRVLLRVAFVGCVLVALVGGVTGGLVRAGVSWPPLTAGHWVPEAVLGHAFLMVCAFLGTVIALERAVALKAPAAYLAPAASALVGLLMLSGLHPAAQWLMVAATSGFVAVNVALVRRQRAAHTVVLLVAALAWWAGALVHALGGAAQGAIAWWFAFLVLTIAAERLEMTRLMRRRPGASGALLVVLATLLVGCVLSTSAATAIAGGLLFGVALVLLSAWLSVCDIARRTVTTHGLPRYMAVCLLLGYGWLGLAGVAWMATTVAWPLRDLALHGLALGFVFSMIFGHAPVILPALARVKLHYSAAFYLPLGLLHLSLSARLLLTPFDSAFLRLGSLGNAASIALFMLVVAGSAWAWRVHHPPRSTSS